MAILGINIMRKLEVCYHKSHKMEELDVNYNIYNMEEGEEYPLENKTTFFAELNGVPCHTYFLSDKNSSNSKYIVSASKLDEHMKWWEKVPEFSIAIFNELHLKKGFDMSNQNPTRFDGHVHVIRETLWKYFGSLGRVEKEQPFVEYKKRRELMQTHLLSHSTTIDICAFFKSDTFRTVEKFIWYDDIPEKIDDDLIKLGRFLYNSKEGRFPDNLHKLFHGINCTKVLTGVDVIQGVGMAREAGKMLHSRIEAILKNKDQTLDDDDDKYPVREPEDEQQIKIMLNAFKEFDFRYVEHCIGSYKHRVCGMIDALALDENGKWNIIDWKRSASLLSYDTPMGRDGNTVIHIDLKKYARSNVMIKYAIQLAVYRKLLLLNGYDVNVLGRLVVFHPMFGSGIYTLVIDLTSEGRNGFSPMQHVNNMFQKREELLRKRFATC